MNKLRRLAAGGRILHGAGDLLRRLLHRYDLSASSMAVPLAVEASPGDPIDFTFSEPAVHDGLKKLIGLGARVAPMKHASAEEPAEDSPRVLRAYLITAMPRVGGVPLKITVSAYVSCPEMIRMPVVRAADVLKFDHELTVRPLAILPESVGVRDASPRIRVAEPQVRDRTLRIVDQPHIRSGADIARVDPEEREGFLREAESMKGIPYGNGELLDLFRNVPVELIAKAHYSEEKRVLLYTLDSGRTTACTRVHDLGIVRDNAVGKTHMVVHRRQFKSVPIG